MQGKRIMWSGYEFEYKEKTADWYWAVSIITVCIGVASFIYGNPLFGAFIMLAGIFLMFTAKKEPRLIDYEISDKGLHINQTVYSYLDFRTFWVSENKYAPPKLLLRTGKLTSPIFVIPIETDYVDANTIRDFLLDYIPEDHINEPLSLKLMEFLGF